MSSARLGSLALAVALAAASALVVSACEPYAEPLTGRGATFDVRATLVANTCGPQSIPVDREARYRAELVLDGARARWRIRASGISADGAHNEATSAFRFAHDATFVVRPADRRTGRAACVLRRLDVIEGTVRGTLPLRAAGDAGDAGLGEAGGGDAGDAGDAGAPSFVASEVIVYGPVAGADCADAIGASDGQFSALPCEQRFEMRGAFAD